MGKLKMSMARKGFTLVEMLVVISLIAILAMGISMLNMNDASQGIYSANRSMMIAFHEARTTALQKQTETRVIIYKGNKDPERRLRQVGVIYKVKDTEDKELGWVALNNGFVMPKNVFFVPPESEFASYVKTSGNISSSALFKSSFNNTYSGSFHIVGIQNFPSTEPLTLTEGTGDWYSYHFSSEGLSMNPGGTVMLALGNRDADDYYVVDNPYSQMGFAIRRIGNTIPFNDYYEMEDAFGGR